MNANDRKNGFDGGAIPEEDQDGDMRKVGSTMIEAIISSYCEENRLPIHLFDGIEIAENIQLKSQARRMAELLDGIIMKKIGPKLIYFWSRQGCPELPK